MLTHIINLRFIFGWGWGLLLSVKILFYFSWSFSCFRFSSQMIWDDRSYMVAVIGNTPLLTRRKWMVMILLQCVAPFKNWIIYVCPLSSNTKIKRISAKKDPRLSCPSAWTLIHHITIGHMDSINFDSLDNEGGRGGGGCLLKIESSQGDRGSSFSTTPGLAHYRRLCGYHKKGNRWPLVWSEYYNLLSLITTNTSK